MRKLGIVVTAIACLMVAAVTFAADTPAAGGMTFGVDGGVALPTGDWADLFQMGFQGGVFGEYGINEQFAIGVGADYDKVGVKDEYITDLEDEASAELGVDVTVEVTESIIPITLYAKWMPPMKDSKVAPYVMVGGGYYMMTDKIEASVAGASISVSETVNKPGFFGGAGVDFKVNPTVKVGVFAKMHDILTEDSSTMYFNGGVSVGFGLATK
jgi:outer membrane protein W